MNRYLGNLPIGPLQNYKKNYKSNFSLSTTKNRDTIFYETQEDMAHISMSFSTPAPYTVATRIRMEVFASLLQKIVSQRLRDNEGLSYSPQVYGSFWGKAFQRFYKYSINADCPASKVSMATSATWNEIVKLKESGPDKSTLEQFKQNVLQDWEHKMKYDDDDGFWMNYLSEQILNRRDLKEILSYRKILDNITKDTIKLMAQEILRKENYQEYLLMPESYKAKDNQ